MTSLKTLLAAATVAAGLAAVTLPAAAQTTYTINGQPAPYQVQQYMAANGLAPGHYWLNQQGYWGVVGESQPRGNIYAGSYVSRYGSGEQAANGWSHYSNSSGYYVGGDANGCIYTPNWSNC